MRPAPAVLVDSVVWAAWGTTVGLVAARLPDRRFAVDGPVTTIRSCEREGRLWERLAVRSWKDRLPEMGALFGDVSKRRLPAPGRSGLERLATETRRAEAVHWAAPLPLLAFPLWNPAWVTAVMAVYAIAANAPCIVVQRYNRARVLRILARRTGTAEAVAG